MSGIKRAFTTMEIVIGCVIALVLIVIFLLFFVGTDTQKPQNKIKKMGYTLQQTVTYAQGNVNQKSTQWDYSLSPNDFFRKYLHEYLNYSHTLERNLEYGDKSRVFYVYFVDDSYFTITKGDCMELNYDANGANKPNEYGVDRYTFYLCPEEFAQKNNFINNPNKSK